MIDHKTASGKAAFGLVKDCKMSKHLEGNCNIAWSRMISKYAPKITLSLLKLKEFENSKLKNIVKNPEDWISDLEGLITEIKLVDKESLISEKEFMVKIWNNLPVEYDVF